MQNTILIAVLAGAIAGAGGALLTQGLVSTEPVRPTAEAAGLVPGESGEGSDLLAQIDALKQENGSLALRLAALEQSSGSSGRQAISTDATEEIEALQNQVVELALALQNPSSPEASSLRNAVNFALEDIRAEEEAEREREREEREIRRMDERMERYKQDLGLDQLQAQQMRTILDLETVKRDEMFAAMREGNGDRGEMRTMFNDLRTETQSALSGILTTTQMETYQKSSDRGFGGGRGFGGDAGGGRGGRGR